jgi:hypothetical protein
VLGMRGFACLLKGVGVGVGVVELVYIYTGT